MTEVSSWSATDASNNLTPPDGWPEGMQPSGVNNVGRMMMGAIARWYATVSAGIANCLPLSGGTLTGTLTAPQLTSTGNINAVADIGCRSIYASGTLNVTGGAGISGGLTTTNVHATNNVTADGSMNTAALGVSGAISSGSLGTGPITGTSLWVSADIAGNAVTANYIHSYGQLDVGGTLNSGVTNTANLTVNGSEGVTGNLTVAGFANAGEYRIQGALLAGRGVDGAGALNGIYDGAGGIALALYGPNGSYYRCDNAHSFTNRAATYNICRFQTGDGNTINISGYWNIVSDERVKREVEPYEAGLPELERLNVVSYRYTEDAPFNDGQVHYGLVAQDVETVLPEMVRHAELSRPGSDETADYLTMAPGHLVFVLTNAVKALAAQNAQLSARLATLEGDRHV